MSGGLCPDTENHGLRPGSGLALLLLVLAVHRSSWEVGAAYHVLVLNLNFIISS